MSINRCLSIFVFSSAILWATSSIRIQASEEADRALEQLAWAVGGKWVSELKGPDGSPLTVETTFDWSGHRKSIKYAVVFKFQEKSTTQYEGVYWWSPEKKQLMMLQIDGQGNVTESTLVKEGDQFKQRNTVTLADGTKREQRAEFTREGDDVFAFKAFIRKGDDWAEAVALKYKRVRDAK